MGGYLVSTLAHAWIERVQGERADNIEQAIRHHEQEFLIHSRQHFPARWAEAQHNLGVVYSRRIRGDRADNLERAIEYFRGALEVRTREALPAYWSQTQDLLGGAYQDRIRGDRADNLERAIAHHRQTPWKLSPRLKTGQ